MKQHERYREYSLDKCANGLAEGEPLGMVLFKKEAKLRSHAVKHFTNTVEEFGDQELMVRSINELEALGCPFIKKTQDNPPCVNCRYYEPCTRIVAPIQDAYLNLVEKNIEEGKRLPRYVLFDSSRADTRSVWFLSDGRFVAKALKIPHKHGYNLATCFRRPDLRLNEFIETQRRKILNESKDKKQNIWCDKSNWGLESEKTPKAKKTKKTKPKKSKKAYKRGGGGNWRKFIDH